MRVYLLAAYFFSIFLTACSLARLNSISIASVSAVMVLPEEPVIRYTMNLFLRTSVSQLRTSLQGMNVLDFLDFLTNSVMMPIAAFATCILVVRVLGCKAVADEVKKSSAFKREKIYNFVIRYLAPVCIVIILFSSVANVMGWITL